MEPNKKNWLDLSINSELVELMDEEYDFGLSSAEELTQSNQEERDRLDEEEMDMIEGYFFSDEQD